MKRLPNYIRLLIAFVIGISIGRGLLPKVAAQTRAGTTTKLIATDLAGWCDGKAPKRLSFQ